MFTWTHIGERRFDWRAFRLQNKILLLLFFFTFNHQNVNSKCNNDAQMWKEFVWICTFKKTLIRFISRPAESVCVGGGSTYTHLLFSVDHDCHLSTRLLCVLTPLTDWFHQINPVVFSKCATTRQLRFLGHAFLFKYIPCIHVKSQDMREQNKTI